VSANPGQSVDVDVVTGLEPVAGAVPVQGGGGGSVAEPLPAPAPSPEPAAAGLPPLPVDEPERNVLLVTHTGRSEARDAARKVAHWLSVAGIGVRMLAPEVELDRLEVGEPGSWIVPEDRHAVEGCELVVVLGGDGTLLRGAELARMADIPLLGVNLGRVGFLAEAELEDLHEVVERIVEQRYEVEERMTLDVRVTRGGSFVGQTWALNEASVEKRARERMLEVLVEVDGRPLSRWGCDGVVCATPTGSTAYAFSAGGPIVWPGVEALLLVPISAHALFARPLVAAPDSVLAIDVQDGAPAEYAQEPGEPGSNASGSGESGLAEPGSGESGSGEPTAGPASGNQGRGHEGSGVLWCDGRRTLTLPPGARIEVRRGRRPVRLARLHQAPFTDRLVAKFALPVEGWRAVR
jgi:NAD+ kinase